MSKTKVHVYVLLEHHIENYKDAKVIGVYVSQRDALRAKERYVRNKPMRLSQQQPKIGYLAVLKMPLKGMYIKWD